MTLYLADYTAWQGPLTPADFERAEFRILSFKISHGLARRAVRANIANEVLTARALGMELGTSHFLTGDASGADQATYAFQQMSSLGLLIGTGHQADAENNPVGPNVTLPILREYIDAMQQRLQRHLVLYTGDHWWEPRGWDVSDLTPYLWAAPNDGYLSRYPGDTSSHWQAGYGGWPDLAIMQYAVSPLTFPDGPAGTVKVSKSAIRDPAVWSALTLGSTMPNSPEYPDLKWMPPKSWTNANRTSIQLIVIHDTEGSEGPTSAENGAAYNQRRTDGTSAHYFHDSDSTVQCVRTEDIAHTARNQGNKRGIQHELCGRAGQGAAGWADTISWNTLRQAARQCARDARKWDIPVRKLTAAQVADGVKGFCGHVDITKAFPQDNGTHTDPGPTFPWTEFLGMVQDEIKGIDMDEASIAAKLAADLGNTNSGLYKAEVKLQRATLLGVLWDAVHAIRNDSSYQAMSAADQQAARNARDLFREIVGAPVDQTAVISAISSAIAAASAGEVVQLQADIADLMVAVGGVDEQVMLALSNPATPDQQLADAIVRLLGDRKDAVLPLMR